MKVLYGITVGGSAGSLLRGQLRWMKDRGWDVVLVTNPDDDAILAARREGVALRTIPMRRNISLAHDAAALARWVRAVLREAPAVVNGSTPKAGLLSMVAAWLTRVPRRVYVVRGLRLEGAHGAMAPLLWLMEWLTMRAATDLVFVSESLATAAFERRLGSRSRSWLIGAGSSNGVDAAAVAERARAHDPESLRHEIGIEEDVLVAGFIGRVTFDKGVGTIADAAADPSLDPRWRFLVIGAVEDEGIAARLDSSTSVIRLDYADDVWSMFPAMDVLVLPTLREGFPNVVLEAAAAGIPSITTRSTGAVDSVVDGETGRLFDFGDTDALVAVLNDFARSPERIAEMGIAAEARVRREYAPDGVWEGVHRIMSGDPATPDVRRLR